MRGRTEVAGCVSSVPQSVKVFSTEAVEPMTVQCTVPTLVPGSKRWLSVSATDVHAAG